MSDECKCSKDHAQSEARPAQPHGHAHDFVNANKAYFDEQATHKGEEMYSGWREMARKEVDAMRAQWPALFDKERTVVLDFACGIGACPGPGFILELVG